MLVIVIWACAALKAASAVSADTNGTSDLGVLFIDLVELVGEVSYRDDAAGLLLRFGFFTLLRKVSRVAASIGIPKSG